MAGMTGLEPAASAIAIPLLKQLFAIMKVWYRIRSIDGLNRFRAAARPMHTYWLSIDFRF